MNSRLFITLSFVAIFAFGHIGLTKAQAVDESLANLEQEQLAREIMADIRCLVCQNQSIEDSDADLAKDLRMIVREQVAMGKTEQQVHDFLLERYGDWILLEPPLRMRTILLWFGPLVFLLFGGGALYMGARGTKNVDKTSSPEKKSKSVKTKFEINRIHIVGFVVALGFLSVFLYAKLGQPNMANPTTVNADENALSADAEIQSLYLELKKYVTNNPDDIEGQSRFAEMSERLGHLAEAANAYGRLYALNPNLGPTPLVLQGEAMVRQAQGAVTPAARLVFLNVISLEPNHPAARYYLGLWFLQNEDVSRALEIWELLKTDSQPEAPWLPMLDFQINLIKDNMQTQTSVGMPQPTAQDMLEVESMSAEEQQNFISSMVERLRTRLENNPDDYEGWWRLGRVEAQLGNVDAALSALEQAEIYAPEIKRAEISAEYLLLEQQFSQ